MSLPANLAILLDYVLLLTSTCRSRVALVVGLMLCVGLSEGASVLLLVPLLNAAGVDLGQGSIQGVADLASSFLQAVGITASLSGVLGTYVMLMVTRAVVQRTQTVTSQRLQHDFAFALRVRVYRAITHSQWIFFSRVRGSDFAHVLTAEVDRVNALTAYFLALIVQSVLAAVYLAFALHLSPVATVVAGGCGVFLLVSLRRGVARSRETGDKLSRGTGRMYAAVTEHLGAMKVAKSYGAEERNTDAFSERSREVADAQVTAGSVHATTNMWFQIGSVVILSLVLFVTIDVLRLSVGAILVLLFLFARLVPQFSAIQRTFQYLTNVLPSFQGVMITLERCRAAAEAEVSLKEDVTLRSGVQLVSVTFRYRPDAPPVLHSLDLTIPVNKTTAVVGRSGVGKSTIADMVLGLLTPEAGLVLVDGRELSPSRLRAWRERVGYVAQDTVLFHETIRANLLWATPAASEKEIWQALALSAAEEFVRALPQGLETVIGDRGVQLSGGERQRIALARALLRKPAMVILDEASSALDGENETRILEAIERLQGSITVLVITHRLETIRHADTIHLLQDGLIIESGRWDDLRRRSTYFGAAYALEPVVGATPS